LRELLLPVFPTCFSIALDGIADCDFTVKKNCTQVFRLLIPLVPLAKLSYLNKKISYNQKSYELFDLILGNKAIVPLNQSKNYVDRCILSKLSRSTNNLILRDYQWDGVSWLTQLRRCGLSGILADEMGLGKRFYYLLHDLIN
jgi:hypothetical protein